MKINSLCVFVCLFAISPMAYCQSVFMIGNSLTWDTKPQLLDGNVQWNVFCNRNLQYIYDNPSEYCVSSSVPWDVALVNNQYEYVVVQPFAGTTLEQDATIISSWMALQPDAKFIVHPGWASYTNFAGVYNGGNPDNMMRPNPAYINDLIDEIESRNPGRSLGNSQSHDLLWLIYQDIEAGIGPFDHLSDLYRDTVHMDYSIGRFLMHNMMRRKLGQSIYDPGDIDPEIRDYLLSKIDAVSIPEPNCAVLSAAALLLMIRRKRRFA